MKHPQQYLSAGVARGRQIVREHNADARRGEFLRHIHPAELSQFESDFLSSFLTDRATKPAGDDFQWFTPARRNVVDRMIQQHGMRTAASAAPAPVLQAAAGKCGYILRAAGELPRLCNDPAVSRLRHGLELCASHEAERVDRLARIRELKARQMRS
jgi:hypothetical protein